MVWILFESCTWTYGSSVVCISKYVFVSELFVSKHIDSRLYNKDILFSQVVKTT